MAARVSGTRSDRRKKRSPSRHAAAAAAAAAQYNTQRHHAVRMPRYTCGLRSSPFPGNFSHADPFAVSAFFPPFTQGVLLLLRRGEMRHAVDTTRSLIYDCCNGTSYFFLRHFILLRARLRDRDRITRPFRDM